MLDKKSPKANLEDKKVIPLLVGFVLALSVLYVSLEWSSEIKFHASVDVPGQFDEVVIVIPQTKTDSPVRRPPKVAPKVTLPPIVANPNPVDNLSETGTETFPTVPEPSDTSVPQIPSGPVVVDEPEEDVPFVFVEHMPEFPGNIFEYLARHIRYPIIDQENGVQGKVICQFVVDRDGSIVDFKIVRGVSPTIDKEAKRVVESMPKWKPGKQRDKTVKVKYTLPINFTLKNS